MSERRQNTLIGLFAITAIVVLCILIFIFGGGRMLAADAYDVTVYFPAGVIGIQQGQGVTFNGKRVGETRAVEFADPAHLDKGINVIVSIDGKYQLPRKSEVTVNASLMGFGRPMIQMGVTDPTDPVKLPKDGTAVVRGRMVPMLDQVLPKDIQTTLTHATRDIGNLAAALEPVAIEFRRMLEARSIHDVDLQKATANVDTLIQRFDATLRNFNEIIGNEENQANLAAAVANARKMTESGNAMIEEFRAVGADARPVLLSAAKLTEKLAQTTDDMSTVLRRLDQTMALVNDGTGTASLFLRDNRLYEELILTVKRMTKTLDDVRDVMELAKTGQLRIRAF